MESYYRSPELSDIKVEVTQSNHAPDTPETRAAKRHKHEAVLATFPAHKLCLSSNSSVMKNEVSVLILPAMMIVFCNREPLGCHEEVC